MLSLQERINNLPSMYDKYPYPYKEFAYYIYLTLVMNDSELLPKGRRSLLKADNLLGNSIYDRCLSVVDADFDYWSVLVYVSSIFYTHLSVKYPAYKGINPKEINSSYTINAYNRIKDRVKYRYVSLPDMDRSFALVLPINTGDTYESIRKQVLHSVERLAPDLLKRYLKMSKSEILSSALKMADISLSPASLVMLRHDYPKLDEARDIIRYKSGEKGLNSHIVDISLDDRLKREAINSCRNY